MQHGLEGRIDVDSAGTGAWHIGEPPDRRMRQTAARRGYSLDSLRARQLAAGDLETFDLILAMDRENLSDIRRLDATGRHGAKIRLFREFDPDGEGLDVPDPYWSGEDGFDEVLTMVERTAAVLIDHLSSNLSTE